MPTPNNALRAAREATPSPQVDGVCMSRDELADSSNRWLATHSQRHAVLDSHYIGRLEQGRIRWPNEDYRAALTAVLGVEQLGFHPPTTHRAPVRPLARGNGEPAARSPVAVAEHRRTDDDEVRRSQDAWLGVRQPPKVRGRELTELAAWLYPPSQCAPGGHVLTAPGWLLQRPIPLDQVRLRWSEKTGATPTGPFNHVLPLTDTGERYTTYSRAVRDLVRPRLLENRPSYRLLGIDSSDSMELAFGPTMFFDVFDVKYAIAHEFKSAWLANGKTMPDWPDLPLRAVVDPFDLQNYPISPGVNTLTIRQASDGEHQFILHERDGTKVADGGGLSHVMPAGEFQPSSPAPAAMTADLSLWRNIMREFSEEFLGNPEHDGNHPIDYDDEPFRSFSRAREAGRFRMWYYGTVIEPLELGGAQITVAVLDADTFDTLFSAMVATNDEGDLVRGPGHTELPFTAETIERMNPRLSASALTLLQMAWRDRDLLLGE